MGESAGAASVHFHAMSTHNHLFHKIILQAYISDGAFLFGAVPFIKDVINLKREDSKLQKGYS